MTAKNLIMKILLIILIANGYYINNAYSLKINSKATYLKAENNMDDDAIANPYAIPSGDYLSYCINCRMISGTNTNVLSTLQCNCGGVLSTLQNAWACNGCLTSVNGNLKCKFPRSSRTNGYKSLCSGCGISDGSLFCNTCNYYTPEYPFEVNCGCAFVMYQNGNLMCALSSGEAPHTGIPSPNPSIYEQESNSNSSAPSKPESYSPSPAPSKLESNSPTPAPSSR